MESTVEQSRRALSPYLSPVGAWAFALGTSIGWGSFVVTSNTYLLQAGPWGSIFGLLVGAVVMLIVGRNYHYMINCFPDAGGAYTYAKEVYGHDSGFLTAWFLSLTYIAIFWANVTSLPLFAHYFMGDVFKVGFLYNVLGYDVYLGEALLSIVAILLVAAVCARSRKNVMRAMIGMAVLFTGAIVICYLVSAVGFAGGQRSFDPVFIPDKDALSQVLLIACISPWAFIGFENISHFAEEYTFPRSRVYRVLVIAIVSTTLLYILVLLLSVMAYPPEYSSWLAYISDLGNLDGIKGLPAFYVAYHYLGDAGVTMLMLGLLGLIGTSLVGNTVALSRLFYSMGKDNVIPQRFGQINGYDIPGRAIFLVAALSVAIPFLGRTAIGWIVDVTTIGATIIYGFVSASASKVARARGDKVERFTGVAGVVLMVAFGAYLLLPVLFQSQSLESESYFLFATWGILGFIFFRNLLVRDTKRRYGRSVVVWIGLLSLVLFVSFVWMNQSLVQIEADATNQVISHYEAASVAALQDGGEFAQGQFVIMRDSSSQTMLIAALLFAVASAMLLSNFSYMSKWAQKSEEELDRTKVIVYTDPLTGLPSIARFGELARAGSQALADRGQQPVAVVLRLMGMNDYRSRHGREGGDQLIRAFADVLRAHYGDEFCSRLADDTFYAYTTKWRAEDNLKAVFSDFEDMEGEASLPIRAGLYACEEGDDIVAVGFDRAQAACDLDRTTWQSHFMWFKEEMSDESRLRLHVLHHVDQAIEERWIRPYYQAIVNAETGVVCNEEALARWIDPEYGFLSPGQFIPILEGASLLHKVDMHMIGCVLEDMQAKRSRGVPVVPVSVNVSLRDLGQVDIADEVVRMVDAANLPHEILRIEFTESAVSENPDLFKTEVDALRSAGFSVWMDDFGSGYSSLNSLKDFEFDLVKLDMEFMRNERGERTWDVIFGVAQITQRLGMKLLAEGVETELQAQRLKEVGCDMLQGFYFAKPEALEDVMAHFEDGSGLPRE